MEGLRTTTAAPTAGPSPRPSLEAPTRPPIAETRTTRAPNTEPPVYTPTRPPTPAPTPLHAHPLYQRVRLSPFSVEVVLTSSGNGPSAVDHRHLMDVAQHHLLEAFRKGTDDVQQIVIHNISARSKIETRLGGDARRLDDGGDAAADGGAAP